MIFCVSRDIFSITDNNVSILYYIFLNKIYVPIILMLISVKGTHVQSDHYQINHVMVIIEHIKDKTA